MLPGTSVFGFALRLVHIDIVLTHKPRHQCNMLPVQPVHTVPSLLFPF